MENEQIIIKLQETADRTARNEGRIKKLETENAILHQLATSVAVMAEQLKTMNKSVMVLTGEMETLKSKPGKRWDWIVNNLIWAFVGGVVAFLLAQIGLGG